MTQEKNSYWQDTMPFLPNSSHVYFTQDRQEICQTLAASTRNRKHVLIESVDFRRSSEWSRVCQAQRQDELHNILVSFSILATQPHSVRASSLHPRSSCFECIKDSPTFSPQEAFSRIRQAIRGNELRPRWSYSKQHCTKLQNWVTETNTVLLKHDLSRKLLYVCMYTRWLFFRVSLKICRQLHSIDSCVLLFPEHVKPLSLQIAHVPIKGSRCMKLIGIGLVTGH